MTFYENLNFVLLLLLLLLLYVVKRMLVVNEFHKSLFSVVACHHKCGVKVWT